MGIFVALEGIDMVGKTTQVDMLAETLIKQGFFVATISFPRYDTPIGQVIKSYLYGETIMDYRAVQYLYEADKIDFQHQLSSLIHTNHFVISDRYTLSGVVYGLAKSISLSDCLVLQKHVIQPDIQIVLDMDVELIKRRGRSNMDNTDKDYDFLQRVRKLYLDCSSIYDNIFIVDASQAPEQVHREICDIISSVVK